MIYYKTYMKRYLKEDSANGDLAKDIYKDSEFISCRSFNRLYDYLLEKNACSEAINIFINTYIQYIREEGKNTYSNNEIDKIIENINDIYYD